MTKLIKQKGFTLIELLIVIVIIGILASVLIAVINPAQQQNRAKDAGVQATLNKVALATEGFVSAYGRTPTDTELIGSLQNATDLGTCADGTDKTCIFAVTGNTLLDDCDATGWSGIAGGTQCGFYYNGLDTSATVDVTHFRLIAKSFGIVNTVFLYDNKVGEITECPASGGAIVSGMVATAGATDGTPCN